MSKRPRPSSPLRPPPPDAAWSASLPSSSIITSFVLVGTIIHSTGLAQGLRILTPGILGVSRFGTILFCIDASSTAEGGLSKEVAAMKDKWGVADDKVIIDDVLRTLNC